ncbi:hypothetical protein ACKVF1_004788, partial [Escherichia coli]
IVYLNIYRWKTKGESMYLTKKIIISMMLILTSAAFSSDPPPLQQSLEKTTYFSIGMNGF